MVQCVDAYLVEKFAGVTQDWNEYHYTGAPLHSSSGKWIQQSANYC